MNKTDHTLWTASLTGNYPPGTTATTLAQAKLDNETTVLHLAAEHGHLPEGTTATDLAKAKNHNGVTALHIAAKFGHLPQGTTPEDLATTISYDGWTALHLAAFAVCLPPNTSASILKKTTNQKFTTAWESLWKGLQHKPTQIIQLPHSLFTDDHLIAIGVTHKAIQKDPNLQFKATLWLGHVLALQPIQRARTDLTR